MRSGPREGFILVAVLGIMVLLLSLTGGTALLVRSALNGVRGTADDLTLDALIRAGLDVAAYELFDLRLPPARIREQRIDLDSGSITLTAADESGRIDLNWSDPVLLAGAYRVAGLTGLKPDDFAARVVQWRDRYADKPAKDADPAKIDLAAKPVGQGKDGFRTVSEIRWLPGVSEKDAAALAPLLTVDNVQGRVNALEASAAVLMALPEMTPSLVAQVAALRTAPSATVADRIKVLLPKQQMLLTTNRGLSFRVRVAVATAAAARRSVAVTLTRAPTRDAPYFVTAWER
ncbi:general secretion pathway protein GspK [uncultured Methylobacterium sp.]|uniref:general secretion pathway protein GspK n=1 Tax=uncultured Methylobacterium sp. TaxID=157278 RepID=UPI0035CBEB7A